VENMQRSNGRGAVIAAGSIFLLLALILKGIPVIGGLLLAFKSYRPEAGIMGSPFAGFANMERAFYSMYFPRIILNTVIQNLLYLIIVLVVSFILAISLAKVNRVMQNFFITLVLVPLFIPGNSLAHICLYWFKGAALARQELFPFIYAILLAVKNVGIPAVFILKTMQIRKELTENDGFGRLMAPVAFVMVQLAFVLSTDMDIVNNLISPLVYVTGDNMDYYIYRTGFMQMDYGVSQSIWLFRMAVQLIIGFIAYFMLYVISRSSFSGNYASEYTSPQSQNINPAGFAVPLLYSAFIIWFVFKPLVSDGIKGIFGNMAMLKGNVLSSYVLYILVYGLIAMAGVPVTVIIAKSILTGNAFGKLTKFIFIILFIAGGTGIHQYLIIRNMGLFNTVFCYIPYYIIPVANSLVLAVILYFHKSGSAPEEHVLTWKYAFALGILQFIKMWNSEFIPMILTARQDIMPPVLLSKILMQGVSTGGISMEALLGMDLISSVLPVALFLIFRRFITEWALLAYIKVRY